MGVQRENGYSATVEAFFVLSADSRIRLAKTNGCTFVVAEPCELPPGTTGDLVVIVDGCSDSRRVVLPSGIANGEMVVRYSVQAPF